MASNRDRRIRELFDRLVSQPASSWEEALACEEPTVAREVRGLLAAAGETAIPPPPGVSSIQRVLHATLKTTECAEIGPYTLLEQIGEGGMGAVYHARQQEPIRRDVALKLIKVGIDTKEVVARFEAERQALALMNHPCIAKVLDAGVVAETGKPYFVMEYVAGERITDYCDRHNLSTRQRLELFAQVCEAIQHAHNKGIIHRDIKPSNILVTLVDNKPTPKVIDFGIAKAINGPLTEKTLFTQHGQMIGTPEYMSPEQAEMNALDVDTRSDVYSLGVLLYELLVGALPFDPKTLRSAAYREIQRIIREVDPPRPSTRLSNLGDLASVVAKHRKAIVSQLQQELRDELEWIPLKAMRKDRTERYRSAIEMADDVRNYLGARPLIAAPESTAYRIRKFVRRNRTRVIMSGSVAAIVLATATTAFVVVEKARRAEMAARLDLERQASATDAFIDSASGWLAGFAGFASFRQKMLADSVEYQRKLVAASLAVPSSVAVRLSRLGLSQWEAKLHDDAIRSLTDAADTFRTLVTTSPSEPSIMAERALANTLVNLGGVFRNRGDLDGALKQFTDAASHFQRLEKLLDTDLQVRRDHAQLLHSLGTTLRESGRLADAAARYEEALVLRREIVRLAPPNSAVALFDLADNLYNQAVFLEEMPDRPLSKMRNVLDEAADNASRLLALGAADTNTIERAAQIYGWLGDIDFQLGDQTAGKVFAEKSRAAFALLTTDPKHTGINPKLSEWLGQLSQCQLLQGQSTAALATIERAITLAPDDPILQMNRAHALLLCGKLDDAITAYRHRREVAPKPDEFRTQLSRDLALFEQAGLVIANKERVLELLKT